MQCFLRILFKNETFSTLFRTKKKQKKIILSLKYEKIDKIWIFMKITDLLGNTDNVVLYFFLK